MQLQQLQEIVGNGRFFSITFVKRDNTIRKLNGRTSVKKYVTGEGLKFDPATRNLLGVFDVQIGEYRFVNANTVISIKANGREYVL